MDIIIDAGHNKLTAGKRSFDNSFFEYEFNFDIATKIKKHLDRHNIKSMILVSEKENSKSEINERLAIIQKENPKIVVSIHANAFGSDWNTANGWEIYTYRNKGESYRLAQTIEKHSIPFLGLRNRGIKGNSVSSIVDNTTMPAVLIEHGFYTNKEEVEKLKSQEFRNMCALADAKGIVEYLGIKWVDEVVEPQKIYKVQVGAFSKKENAEKLAKELVQKGYKPIIKED